MIDGLKTYTDRKVSGLPWLGEIPSTWDVRRTKTQFRLSIEKSGKDHGEELLSIYTHIGVRPRKDLEEKGNKASTTDDYWVVRKGDIIVNKLLAWMGAVGVSHYDGVTSPAYDILRPVKRLEPDYYHYLFRTDLYKQQFKIRSRGIMEMRLRLYFDQFGQIPIPCPPPEEQAAIVRFLDHADRRIRRYIRAKRQLIALLNEQKQAIIHRAVTRGLDPHVKLKPSGVEWLGDVPEHWESKRLRHISPQITVGVVVNPSSYFDDSGSIPMLLGNNIREDNFLLDDVRRIDDVSDRVLSKSRLYAGDLVVVRVGAPGVAAVIPESLNGCNCASVVIVRRSPTFNSRWLMHLFNSQILRSQIDVVKYGAAQKQFNISHAVNFWCPFPPLDEQVELVNAIDNEVRSLDGAIDDAFESISLLHEYRTRLIADVVTGKLDVREAAAALTDELEAGEADAEDLLDEDNTTDDVELDTEPEGVEA